MTPPIRTLAAAFLLTMPLAAQVLPAYVYPASWPAYELTTADVDGDGLMDLVSGGSDLVVTLRQPAGGFLAPVHYPATAPARFPVLGDLNDDGALDVVWAQVSATVSATVQRRLGNGQGGFGSSAGFPGLDFPNATVMGDFDGDGDADVAVKGGFSNSLISFLLSDGAAQLQPAPHGILQLHGLPAGLGTADIDADGDLDVVSFDGWDGASAGAVVVLAGNGSGGFTATPKVNSNTDAWAMTLGDIDEDGDTDVLCAGSGVPNIQRLLNSGTGTLTPLPLVGPLLQAILLSDVDGDGYDDIVGRTGWDVQVLRGQPGPGFGSAESGMFGDFMPVLLSAHAVLDVGGDGLPDLVAGSSGSSDVTVLRNVGFGEFPTPSMVSDPDESWDIVAKDLNGDGLGDVALSFGGGPNWGGLGGLFMRLNDGQGTLMPGSWISTVPATIMTSGDLDADGDMDLVFDPYTNDPPGFAALFNDGSGSFGGLAGVTAGTAIVNIACGDVDGDGDDDVVLRDLEGSVVMPNGNFLVTLSDGAGGFSTPTSFPALDSRGLALADFNVDGALDIVAGGYQSSTINVHLGNGAGGFSAKLASPVPHSPDYLTAGDLDGDGDPDVAAVHAPGTGAGRLMAATNNGAATFSGAVEWSATTSAAPAIADVDGNGIQDIVVPFGGSLGRVMLVLSNASGSGSPWQDPAFFAARPYPVGVSCAQMDADGLLDVVVQCSQHFAEFGGEYLGHTELVLLKSLGTQPWKHLDQGKAGAAGIPMLVGHGSLQAGEPMSLTLKGAKPLSPATLVIGTSALFAPLKGGTMVPMPKFLLGMGTNASGGLELSATWPAGVPAGVSLWFQVWSTDVVGLAASNGVSGTTP